MIHPPFFLRSASAVAVTAMLGAAAYAAAPEAGSVIGNQAVATYTNSAGDTITVTSNTVETVVQQVAGVTLDSEGHSRLRSNFFFIPLFSPFSRCPVLAGVVFATFHLPLLLSTLNPES